MTLILLLLILEPQLERLLRIVDHGDLLPERTAPRLDPVDPPRKQNVPEVELDVVLQRRLVLVRVVAVIATVELLRRRFLDERAFGWLRSGLFDPR